MSKFPLRLEAYAIWSPEGVQAPSVSTSASFVNRGQSVRHLDGVAEHLRRRQALGSNQLAQPLALDAFHGDEIHVPVRADFVDRNDIRVVQGRRGTGLEH